MIVALVGVFIEPKFVTLKQILSADLQIYILHRINKVRFKKSTTFTSSSIIVLSSDHRKDHQFSDHCYLDLLSLCYLFVICYLSLPICLFTHVLTSELSCLALLISSMAFESL